jgi:hypothetical protein
MFDENNPKWDEGPPTKQPLEKSHNCWKFKNSTKESYERLQVEKWKIPTIEGNSTKCKQLSIFLFFSIFFWKNLTNPPFFIDCKNSKVNRCHPYEADEKKNFIFC